MTSFEQQLANHLDAKVYGLGASAARIARWLANTSMEDPAAVISDRAAAALIKIAYRFRRQLPPHLIGAVLLFHSDLLVSQAAGGGEAVSAAEPRDSSTHEPNRPNPAHPAFALQGRESHEGLPLWSRVSA